MQYITASKIYNYIQCPHRVWRDIYGPKEEMIKEINPFVQLLWDRGVQFEKKILDKIGEFTDLSEGNVDERIQYTLKAMKDGKKLIYQGVLRHENLMGIPDLLKKLPDGYYVPIDIKSGKGFSGSSESDKGKPKRHYAAQLSVYVEILKNLKFAQDNKGLIIDIEENEVEYLLDEQMGPKTPKSWLDYYKEIKEEVSALINNKKQNLPAKSGACKLCPWHDSCKKWCDQKDDLTKIFYLGRSKRGLIQSELNISTTKDLSDLDTENIITKKKKDKNFLKGMGEKTLRKLIARAEIITNTKKPVIYETIDFPKVSTEIFFDIESDPTQNIVYLHGIYERKKKERFIPFLAENNSSKEEKKAWQNFWSYIKSLPEDNFALYCYSSYEKTTCKKLARLYPDIVSEEQVENFFKNPNVVDLYKVVCEKTDWPLSSYSIKDIVSYIGFKWRDETPSGALSIQWYNEYLKTKDSKLIKRILEYNEDDCVATMVLKDELVRLSENRDSKAA